MPSAARCCAWPLLVYEKERTMKPTPTKALVILSGGQDSTTCLYWAKKEFDEVHAVTFDYGQRHSVEVQAARIIARLAGVASHRVIAIRDLLHGTSPLVNPSSELEQYEDHQSLPGGLEKTFVPMRNQLFITIAANHAYCIGISNLVTGVCQEDFGGYPDCTEAFIHSLTRAIQEGTFTGKDGALGSFFIHTPLMYLTKKESVLVAHGLEGCMRALQWSHTAYDGEYPPTGRDHASLLRAKGFEEAGLPDPLVLRAVAEGVMSVPDTPNYVFFHPRFYDAP